MTRHTCAAIFFLSVFGATLPASLGASDPIGVYAVVEKVVLEPSDIAPERVQLWGAFALAETNSNDDYASPQRGYLYYSCPAGQLKTCAKEWSDLKAMAGAASGAGFGGRRLGLGRVRHAAETPASPDVYPIRMGVVRMDGRNDQRSIVARLKAALADR